MTQLSLKYFCVFQVRWGPQAGAEGQGFPGRPGPLEVRGEQGREGLLDVTELMDVKGKKEKKVSAECYHSTATVL